MELDKLIFSSEELISFRSEHGAAGDASQLHASGDLIGLLNQLRNNMGQQWGGGGGYD